VGLALRRLGLALVLEVGLLDAAERLELREHLKTAEISLGDRARLRRTSHDCLDTACARWRSHGVTRDVGT
jgi:hypothetical protein